MIDDDARLYALLRDYLTPQGFELERAADGALGLRALERSAFDLVLLDIMMPGMDGLEVCRKIRATRSVPIVMLTARGDETDRIVGLELGADDYLPKPFHPRELVARMRAVLRRGRPDIEAERKIVGELTIDMSARSVLRGSVEIALTGLEFDVLCALAKRPGQVVPRERLLAAAGRDDVSVLERTVDVHISHLRQKLGEPQLIKTVRGVGYVLAKSEEP